MIEMIRRAAEIALPVNDNDARNFWIGCVGLRKDGTTVVAKNGAVHLGEVDDYIVIPQSHAEVRLLRKLGHDGTVFVARVSRKTGELVMSRPCSVCQVHLRSKRVKKAYYSINEDCYGLLLPDEGTDRIFQL
jgi:hypothetical protein